MQCKTCGRPLPPNSTFCHQCGTPVQQTSPLANATAPGASKSNNKQQIITLAVLSVLAIALFIGAVAVELQKTRDRRDSAGEQTASASFGDDAKEPGNPLLPSDVDPSKNLKVTEMPAKPVGQAATFTAFDDSKYEVKVTSFNPAPQPQDKYYAADAGQKLVAVNVTITNTSNKTTTESAIAEVKLVDKQKQVYTSASKLISGCQRLRLSLTVGLAPGQSISGCVVFEIPQAATPATFTYGSPVQAGTLLSWTL